MIKKYDTIDFKILPAVTKYLIEQGSDVNAVDVDGVSVLMHATFNENDNPTIAKMLVNAGCIVDAKSNEGKNALDYALSNDNEKITEYLRTLMDQTPECEATDDEEN